MNMDPNTEDAADARHNVGMPGGFILPKDMRFEDVQEAPAFEFPPGRPGQMEYVEVPRPNVGLCFSLDGISSFVDIGRSFTRADYLDSIHEVDLRTILAHLDSAARAIKAELDERFKGLR